MASKVKQDGKTPPSAATNLIAGGGAGMMEALVCHPLGKSGPCLRLRDKKHPIDEALPSRYDQGPNAAVAESEAARRAEARLHPHRCRDRQEGDAAGSVQGSRGRVDGHCAQDGHPLHEFRRVQADAGRQADGRRHGAGDLFRWSRGRCDRGRRRRDADGGDQDPPAGAAPQHGGPPRHPQVPQRGARALHGRQGGGLRRAVPRRVADGAAPGQQPGRQLHGLLVLQGGAQALPTRVREDEPSDAADDPDRPRQRRHGASEQRAHRHHQDEAPEDAGRGGHERVESYHQDLGRHVQTRRIPRILQGHHAAHHARRTRPGRHVYRLRVPQGEAGEEQRRLHRRQLRGVEDDAQDGARWGTNTFGGGLSKRDTKVIISSGGRG